MVTYHCKKCQMDVAQSECSVCGARAEVESVLYWCEHCNIPTYEETCPLCGNHGTYFTADVRPVFPEERLLIEIMLGKPFAFQNASVWNGAGNRYYVDGKRISFSTTQLAKYNPDAIRDALQKYAPQNTDTVFQSYIQKWIVANSKRYQYITTEAKGYIVEKSKPFLEQEDAPIFVSFSGGKDSTVVSDLVRKALSNPSVIHIFGNTTLEMPQTYTYIKRFQQENRKTPMLRAENKEQDFFNLCETFGPPSRTLRWCCTIFKTGFISEKIKRTFGEKKTVLTFYGIRRSESASRNQYERSSTGRKITQQLVASPIIDWFDYDIWLYMLTAGVDFNDAYRLGYSRVGCWLCPNNNKWAQFLAEIYMPEQAKKFNTVLMNFAVKMGKTDPAEYVASGGWKARQGGAGMELSKNVAVAFKPCATDAKSFYYTLNRPITEELYELFKPFGILNFAMGNARLGEVYILHAKTLQPILKLQGILGSKELRISILQTPIANRSKIAEIELKFKCQITKYQLCAGCHACESICKHNAIKLVKSGTTGNEYTYKIDDNKCIHCFACINHYTGGCYMRRVLIPRGKGYK